MTEWAQTHLFQYQILNSIMRFLVTCIGYLLAFTLAFVMCLLIGNLASIPFNDLISERVERIIGSWRDDTPFRLLPWLNTLRLLAIQELYRIGFLMIISTSLFIISFFPGIGFLSFPAGWLLTTYFLTFDYVAFPLERRGVLLFRDKARWINTRLMPAFIYGSVLNLLFVIPIVRFLFIPVGVVGGTLLFIDEEKCHVDNV